MSQKYQYTKDAETFSYESLEWIRRAHVYTSLLRYHTKKIHNLGNRKRAAQRCGIKDLTKLSLQDIQVRLKVCKNKPSHSRKNGHEYQRRHLKNRPRIANIKRNEKAAKNK